MFVCNEEGGGRLEENRICMFVCINYPITTLFIHQTIFILYMIYTYVINISSTCIYYQSTCKEKLWCIWVFIVENHGLFINIVLRNGKQMEYQKVICFYLQNEVMTFKLSEEGYRYDYRIMVKSNIKTYLLLMFLLLFLSFW